MICLTAFLIFVLVWLCSLSALRRLFSASVVGGSGSSLGFPVHLPPVQSSLPRQNSRSSGSYRPVGSLAETGRLCA